MAFNFSENENKILDLWDKKKVFRKSIDRRQKSPNFVFFEGPPTANGKPGIHHLISRSFKDLICRYKTMQGYRVERKAGWDTHGLPVEIEVEKKLGLRHKSDIEQYGVDRFNKLCKESVWQYKGDWEKFTKRIGYWIDLENPYVTYDNSYIESVWNILGQTFDKKLLYKDYRVAPYCPRCGTTLSSHEVSQGYKTVKENSVYVKFALKDNNFKNTYILVWTTTPWTLPANVALALNKDLKYCLVEVDNERLFVTKNKMTLLGEDAKVIKEVKGLDLLDLEYAPPFPVDKKDYPDNDLYKIVAADFVSEEDGTGFVHIAPAFGEDDMNVVKELRDEEKYNFPILKTVDDDGLTSVPGFVWNKKFVKDADPEIIESLKKKSLLFKEEMYEHEYPFCWRCKSPLIYYATPSWFIKMKKLKSKLIANNKEINWVPSHLKKGRFGVWLSEIKDWNLSRNRFWATPLPIWECEKCGHSKAISSIDELKNQNYTDNRFYLMRHGHTISLVKNICCSYPEPLHCPLTKKGIAEVKKQIGKLSKKNIDIIIASDLLRARETAEIISDGIGVDIMFDSRLREINFGDFNGENYKKFVKWHSEQSDIANARIPNGESYVDVQQRVKEFIADINKNYSGKNILIVSHGAPLAMLESVMSGEDLEKRAKSESKKLKFKTAEIRKLNYTNLPLGDDRKIDLHKPYIDDVKFICEECGERMARTPEVIDCWFDSGAMPFAQNHYPFENKESIDGSATKKQKASAKFPADFICEAVDQTRGWFYTLLAISTLLEKGAPYKNVISLGHVLDEKGEKMSKSKGNIVDPWYIIDKYGVDAARWYFFTVNKPGEPKLFNEKDVDKAVKKFLMTLTNCLTFYQTYGIPNPGKLNAQNVLDKWILSKLNTLVNEVTESMNSYDAVTSARAIEKFINDDLSLWYVRRSRKRFQRPESKADYKNASATSRHIFDVLARLVAPYTPFIAEELFIKLKEKNSVHLADWPIADKKKIDKNLEEQMDKVREIVKIALSLRAKEGIKVRQPLNTLYINDKKIVADKNLCSLIKEELNVKDVAYSEEIKLDTEITPELREEGIIREIIRFIQDARKEAGLQPGDKIRVVFTGDNELSDIIKKSKTNFSKEARIAKIDFSEIKPAFPIEKEAKIGSDSILISIKKIK